jgi:hypothetical protein
MNNNFAVAMYFWKYVKKLAIASFKVGFTVKGEVWVIDLTPAEFLELSHAYFEELSDANIDYRNEHLGDDYNHGEKKHLRLAFKATELKNLLIKKLGYFEPDNYEGIDKNIISSEDWKKALKVVKAIKNQDNKGYALELCILEDGWEPKKRGIDIDDNRIEIKFMNGQIEL